MAKKTPETKEAAAERRQRDLAALTSGVAAFSLMGEAPRPSAPVVVPAAQEPVAATPPAAASAEVAASQPVVAEPETKQEKSQPVSAPAPVAPSVEATAPAGRGGEEATSTNTVAASLPSAPDEDLPEEAEPGDADPKPAGAATELDLAQLFVPSAEKKGTTLRITAEHQQFFAQVGFILGAGASAPDIIHNVLARFRADHEIQIQKAMKKQLRQMMSPKK
ncbi:hypothetical protein [Hymenobacter terricola]|uniref:hypothetical protein n=1 Tax=Hymenobacter terricola TaxID=2819236 RepID=UPI001CF13194|nr:hypothetical protein [Hymenobacter terricola]